MREFTVSEVLEYSKNIEKESYDFYRTASEKFTDKELKEIASSLSEEELKHYNRINELLGRNSISTEALSKRVSIKNDDYDFLVSSREIPENPEVLTVLETAYEREVRTEAIYRTLLSFTDLAQEVIDVFSDLMAQEKGHASRIDSLMKKYR